MKITEVNDNYIIFGDNAYRIRFDHDQDCCERNYADFEQLDDLARAHDFNMKEMQFEPLDHAGFRFGDNRRTFFVPCYSEQNGYYTIDLDIYFDDLVNKICTCVIHDLQCDESKIW